MSYKPSDKELENFAVYAGRVGRGAQITSRELLDAGVAPSRNEALRLIRYLEEKKVLALNTSGSPSSGFYLYNLDRLIEGGSQDSPVPTLYEADLKPARIVRQRNRLWSLLVIDFCLI